MHGLSHLLSHHSSDNGSGSKSSDSSTSSDARHYDTRFLQELLNQKQDSKLYLNNERHVSRGSVSSAYSYGSSPYGSSHGSNSSNHGANHHHSVYHTIHGNGHHHHHPLHHYHHHYQHHHQAMSSGKASPTSPSPTNEHEKQQHHHHHHHSIQEMIRHFGRRLGHIRRQSECHESPKKREEDFRNRSQSLDGSSARHSAVGLQDTDCETTYRIYESILRQGNERARV